MELKVKDVLRYLGYRTAPAERNVLDQIDEAITELNACVNPKSIYKTFSCTVSRTAVTIGGVTIESSSLANHMKGCKRAALLAVTLGPAADTLIRRHSVSDMSKAAVMQAVCAVMCERYCDDIERRIAEEAALEGLHLRPRFSPGYGDFQIECQRDLFHLLECDRRIGLSMTAGFMLVPLKSVTAVIGFSEEKCCNLEKCGNCSRNHCAFREE